MPDQNSRSNSSLMPARVLSEMILRKIAAQLAIERRPAKPPRPDPQLALRMRLTMDKSDSYCGFQTVKEVSGNSCGFELRGLDQPYAYRALAQQIFRALRF